MNTEPRKDSPTTPHIHPPTQTLSEHENDEQFKTYLNGRDLAYSRAISDVHLGISAAQKVLDRNPHDHALRALIEGQIEGAKEILELLKKARDK